MPKIVILDGHPLNPGDLDWGPLAALGELSVLARTAPADVVARAGGADVVLTNKVRLGREEIFGLPELRFISVLATGTDIVDLRAATERRVVVSNVPGYSTASVAQLTFALLLELTHQVGRHSEDVRRGGWSRSHDFSYTLAPLRELAGLTLGVVGYGAIGRRVAEIGTAFGMRVIANTRSPRAGAAHPHVPLDELFQKSDVVTLHCPLTPQTEGMVSEERLASMKADAFLLNTARGPLIDERALETALREGCIAGAALDVLAVEPPEGTHPLAGAPNCVITPHVAWASVAARKRLIQMTVGNVRAFLAGAPVNVCLPP
jgi:glycerate dehydrogenase